MVIKISLLGDSIKYHSGCIQCQSVYLDYKIAVRLSSYLNYSYEAWLLFMTAVVAMVGLKAVMLLLLLEVLLLTRVVQSLAVCK